MNIIVTKTPFRVSLLGGGSDYYQHFSTHGGAVLSMAIDKYCYLIVKRLPEVFRLKQRVVWSHVENTQHWSEILHPAVKAALQFTGLKDEPLEIHYLADLPARSGIGSSSSFVVGLLSALNRYRNVKTDLVRDAVHLERVFMQEPGGIQDQIAAFHGGINLIEFSTGETNSYRLEPLVQRLTMATILKLESHLVMVNTRGTNDRMDVARTLGETLEKHTDELLQLQVMARLGRDNLLKGDVDSIGLMLREAWELKKRFNPGSSNDYIDGLYQKALTAGAIGGKMMGTGGGGFLLLFVQPEYHDAVRAALGDQTDWVRVKLDYLGTQVLF